jgi:hypothetical protein
MQRMARVALCTEVGSGLAGGLSHHHKLRVDGAEAVNDDLALDTLNRVDHHCHRALVQRLKTLLCVNIDAGQPAAEAGVRVVPAHHHLRPVGLLQHLEHVGLEHGIHGLYGHTRPGLRHREDVHNLDHPGGEEKGECC